MGKPSNIVVTDYLNILLDKDIPYPKLKEILKNKSIKDSTSGIDAVYGVKVEDTRDQETRLPSDTRYEYKFDLDDKQLKEYLSYAVQVESVPRVDLFSFDINEDQLKKIIDTFLDFEVQTPTITNFVLSLLQKFFTPCMDESLLRDTLKRVSLFPTSENEYRDIKNHGFSDRQKEYFSFFYNYFKADPSPGIRFKNIAKEIIFTTFIEKAKELDAEGMIGPNWFRFFEAFYPHFIDQKLFDEYKGQLTSVFILRHPELYKELELNEEVKCLLKNRLVNLIDNELGTYGYPEGLIGVKVQIHNDEITLYQAVNEPEEEELHITTSGTGKLPLDDADDRRDSLLAQIKRKDKEDDE